MKLSITIECNNSAFDDPVTEVAVVLGGFVRNLHKHWPDLNTFEPDEAKTRLTNAGPISLRDTNGNFVGEARFVE